MNFDKNHLIKISGLDGLTYNRKLIIKKPSTVIRILKLLGFYEFNNVKRDYPELKKELERGWCCHVEVKPGCSYFHFDCH